jgi:methionyl-tRNA formyltransferase
MTMTTDRASGPLERHVSAGPDTGTSRPRPRVVCVGANEESRIALEGLVEAGVDIVGLVTLPPDSPRAGSDHADLHPLCARHGIACLDGEDINHPEVVAQLERLAPDYLFTLGWSQLMGEAVLRVPRRYVVGSHPSALPAGRGRAPIPWMILQDQRSGAVSLFRMVAGADAGPLLVQRSFDVPERADATVVYRLAAETLRDAYVELHAAILDDRVREVPQDESRASYRARRVPADGHLDFSQPREAVDRLVRAVTHPYPGAYTYLDGSRVGVWRSRLDDVPSHIGGVGQILARRAGRLLVQAGDGPLWLSDLTIDGHPAEAARFPVGGRFGFRTEDELASVRKQLAVLRQEIAELRAQASHP